MRVHHLIWMDISVTKGNPVSFPFRYMKIIAAGENSTGRQPVGSDHPIIARLHIQCDTCLLPGNILQLEEKIAVFVSFCKGPVSGIGPVILLFTGNNKTGILPAAFMDLYKTFVFPVFHGSVLRIQPCRDSKGTGNCYKKNGTGSASCNFQTQGSSRGCINGSSFLLVVFLNVLFNPLPDQERLAAELILLFL